MIQKGDREEVESKEQRRPDHLGNSRCALQGQPSQLYYPGALLICFCLVKDYAISCPLST